MAIGEFDLIRQYFSNLQAIRPGVVIGIGDDAAVLEFPPNRQLVVATDTLVAGVHFPKKLGAEHIGARALLVNLSDLAAMGAEPLWFTLALTLPQASASWLSAFSKGLSDVATAYSCALVGGDTTCGPLTITITVHGAVPPGEALTRRGAQPGDRVYVTGTPGLGAAGLACLQGELEVDDERVRRQLLDGFLKPRPRLDVGQRLRGVASAAIDISDGLLADLGHICEQSQVGAQLEWEALPNLDRLMDTVTAEQRRQWVLGGGDDYELCFTAPENKSAAVQALAAEIGAPITRIGRIVSTAVTSKVLCQDKHGKKVSVHKQGYQHF